MNNTRRTFIAVGIIGILCALCSLGADKLDSKPAAPGRYVLFQGQSDIFGKNLADAVTQHLVFRLDTYTGKTWWYVVDTKDGIPPYWTEVLEFEEAQVIRKAKREKQD